MKRKYYYIALIVLYSHENNEKSIKDFEKWMASAKTQIDKILFSAENKVDLKKHYEKFFGMYMLEEKMFKNMKIIKQQGKVIFNMIWKITCLPNKKAAELFYEDCENLFLFEDDEE